MDKEKKVFVQAMVQVEYKQALEKEKAFSEKQRDAVEEQKKFECWLEQLMIKFGRLDSIKVLFPASEP